MCKSFNPCNECGYSISKQNQASKMCGICEFKKALQNVKTLSGMYEKLNDKEVSEYHMLEEYKGLEKQGKLLKLPCKFGDNVFVAMKSGGYAQAEVKDFAYFHTCGFCIVAVSDKFGKCNIPFSEFGKTFFRTPEEAEAALKELERTRKNE